MGPDERWLFLAAAAALGCADEAQNVTFGTTRAWLSSPALSSPALSSSERSLRAAASDDPIVTVSLTFDDTEDEQLDAAAVLEAHGLVGTFYVNSPRLHQSSAGADDWLSVADVQAMQQRGHEIGGHTLSHPDLTSLSEPERRRLSGWRSGILPEPALGGEPRLAA
jgi:peptidoglycan/xylan/chitin deacetylase (PgdA/CDA1 family)